MPKVAGSASVAKRKELEFYDTAPEISIFMVCYAMRNSLLELERDFKGGKTPRKTFEKKFESVYGQFVQAADATQRFDIVAPTTPVVGVFSVFFWRWFNWWDDYLKSLPPHVIIKLQSMCQAGNPAVVNYKPSGTWLDYRSRPCFTVSYD